MAEVLAQMIATMRSRRMMLPMYVDLPQSRIFTVFFPSTSRNAPVLVYNPGGPGASGLVDILTSYSPLIIVGDSDGEYDVIENYGSENLTERFNLLYLDIPANTGYSIAKESTPVQYGDVDTAVAGVRVIKAVLKAQVEYVGEDPLIDFFGYSYAGKIWPLIAAQLLRDGYRIGGLALFSGYTHPILQEIRPLMEYLLYAGFISSTDYDTLEAMTNQIEDMIVRDPSGRNWKHIQDLYIQTVTNAWEAASVNTYDITSPSSVEDALDKSQIKYMLQHSKSSEGTSVSALLSNALVMRAMGVNTPYNPEATTFDISNYQGFLSPSTSALKYLADNGVFIIYIMGSLDGATLAKGTKDMFELLFDTKLQEKRWIVPVTDTEGNESRALIGKISQVTPNVYYATVIGSGHAMESPEGVVGFGAAMEYLFQQEGPTL